MREEIKAQLRRIEEEQNIKILLAVESGSRACDFGRPEAGYPRSGSRLSGIYEKI